MNFIRLVSFALALSFTATAFADTAPKNASATSDKPDAGTDKKGSTAGNKKTAPNKDPKTAPTDPNAK